jgi:putative transposase
VILTYKTQIVPTPEQDSVLWELSEQCRRLYNWALHERITRWQEEQSKPQTACKYLTYLEQQNTLPQLKERVPELRWVYSKVLQMVLRTLDADYKSFFSLWRNGDPKARPPRFKGKQFFTTLKYNQSGFQVRQGVLTLSHKHPSQVSLSFHLPYLPAGTIKQVELYYDRRTNQWFVSFNCQVEIFTYYDNGLYQAFDTGIEKIISAINSQGNFLQMKNRRPEKYWRPKMIAVMTKRDRCQKLSRRWRWYHQKLYRMVRKLTNQLCDFQHWLSQKLVRNTKANTLIFGKTDVKQLAQQNQWSILGKKNKAQKTLHYALQNTGSMSRFIELVAYKAKRLGKRVIPINEAYTTQICAKCGYQQKRLLSERTIICGKCGLRLDRDLNSAVNILAKFYLQKDQWATLLQEPSVNEESFFRQWKGFLRQTANGKTRVTLSSYWTRFGGLVGSPVC